MPELRHDGVVRSEVDAGVALVTLNRPEQRNALNRELQRSLERVVAELDAAADVDAIVLTGADPAFCAGVDLKELASGAADSANLVLSKQQRGPLPPHTTPVIGAVNGVAITGGLEVALACDFLIASDRARFADTHARVGVMPGWGLTVLLPQAVGIRRAREMSVTGNFVDADTALSWGLVNHVVPHEDLVGFALGLAADIATVPSEGVRRMLETYHATADVTVAEAWQVEVAMSREWLSGGIDAAEIEARRRTIVDRGRGQL